MSLNKLKSQENRLRKIQLKSTQNPKYATLIGHIERTFTNDEPLDEAKSDMFSVHVSGNTSGKVKIGINEQKPEYKLSKWCYDTPGVVQPDQVTYKLSYIPFKYVKMFVLDLTFINNRRIDVNAAEIVNST